MRNGPTGKDARDQRLIFVAQGVRAVAYGYGAVLLGIDLHDRGLSRIDAGLVLGAVVAGSALGLVVVGRITDRISRRRVYVAGYGILALAGVAVALSPWWWPIAVVALTGTLSAEGRDSGPFTAVEQAMLATLSTGSRRLRGFGFYNAIAAAGGSLGALLAGGTGVLGASRGSDAFLLLVPLAVAGGTCAVRLSPKVELRGPTAAAVPALRGILPADPSTRRVVLRLSALFGVDSFGAGFTVQAFVAFWLSTRYDASAAVIGLLFFGLGLVQTASMLIAARLGERFGLLSTMVFTHLPSNAFLAAVAFAPSLPVAAALLVGRSALSEMDVPTRQAYVMALVPPGERVRAASATGIARYTTRPPGPVLAGLAQTVATGLPFLIAGTVKAAYDLVLWSWFRHVPLPEEPRAADAVVRRPAIAAAPRESPPGLDQPRASGP